MRCLVDVGARGFDDLDSGCQGHQRNPRVLEDLGDGQRDAGSARADGSHHFVGVNQAGSECACRVGVGRIVIHDQFDGPAQHAAGLIDLLHIVPQRDVLRLAEKRSRPGLGDDRANPDRLRSHRPPSAEGRRCHCRQCKSLDAFHGPLQNVSGIYRLSSVLALAGVLGALGLVPLCSEGAPVRHSIAASLRYGILVYAICIRLKEIGRGSGRVSARERPVFAWH